MERHEFDAAYARICEVCGMKTQTELSAYPRYPPEFHLRRQAAYGRPRRMAADPFDPRRREPYVESDGRRFQILGFGLVASERAHAAAGSSGRAGAGAAHPGGADERDGMYRRGNPGSR